MDITNKYLDERFTTIAVNHPPLPFFHCCEAVHLQSMIASAQISPRYCKVYEEELLYLFYGKPAYKSSETSNSGLQFMMPVCFIIAYEAIEIFKRAVAFDSGAFALYSDHMHESMRREEFHLTPSKEAINKMVHYFFSNNEKYFEGKANTELGYYDPIHYQIESFHSLIKSTHKTLVDDRKSCIEVQLKSKIELTGKNIEKVILPAHLAKSPSIKEFFNERNIPIESITNYGVVASHYYTHIIDKVRNHLDKKNLLNGN